mgnify:CR=1 FL=1
MSEDALGEDVVLDIQHGDAAAAERLSAWFRPRVLMFVHVRTGDRALAEDVAQDVLIAVLRAVQAGQLRDPKSLPGFVFGVARNQLATALRARARAKEDPLEEADTLVTHPIDVVKRDARERLHRAIAELDPLDRQILRLTLEGGHSLSAIADHLGLSHDAVRQRKSRAMKKLTTRLSPPSQKPGVVLPSHRPLLRAAE